METGSTVTTAALYQEHWQFIFQLLPTYGVVGADQEDVAQTVWQNVHIQIDTYDPARQSPRAWLTGFVRRCAANHRRTCRRHTATPCADPGADVAGPGLTPEQYALLRTLEQVIPDERHRETFLLQVRHGLTVREIAVATEATPGEIEWSLARARSCLRRSERST